jgi:PAS domain S-box-containing protein
MRKQLQSPLARRLVVAIILVSSAITLCLTALQLYGEYRGELGDIQADFRRIEEVHLKSLTQSLWATNADDLKLRVEGMVRVPNLEYVAVREGDRLWAQAGRRTSRNVIERQYVMTQVHRGRTLEIGVLTVVAGLDAVYRKLVNRAFTVLASNALKTLLVAGFAFAFFHRLVNRHLLAIAENVRGLDLRGRAPRLILARAAGRRADELDEVTAAINLMHEQVYSTLAVLRESSERLRLAVQASNVGLWDWDFRSKRVVYSREWKAQLGHEEHEIGDEFGEWERRVHPEDLAPTLERMQRDLARPEGAREAEFRMRHKNGTWHWIYARGEIFRDSDGKPERMMGCHVDITERKRDEEALRESEERYRDLVENIRDLICTHDLAGNILFVNRASAELLGYTPGELVNMNLREIIAPAVRAEFEAYLAAIQRDGMASGLMRVRSKAGETRIWEYHNTLRADGAGAPTVRGLARDISERKRAVEALRDSEANFRTLFEQAAVGVGQIETGTGRFAKVNRRYCEIVGYTEEEMQRLTFREITHPEDLERDLDNMGRLNRGEISGYFMEKRYLRKDGAIVWVKLAVSAPWNFGGSPFFHTAVVDDITESKRADDQICQANERLQALSRRLLEVQETERRSIARELHDEVGGVLTAVKLNLQSLRRPRTGDAAEAALADGLALVDGAIQSVRSLSLDLRPAVLDDLGLIPALKSYCERQAQRAGIPIELALDAIDVKAAPQLESACFRIVQESVTNALRHANARRIQIALHRVDASFSLEIADDGDGFDVAAARKRGFAGASIGLLGMEERANLLGGRLSIVSAPGAGVRVRVEFSMPEEGSS